LDRDRKFICCNKIVEKCFAAQQPRGRAGRRPLKEPDNRNKRNNNNIIT
jgi:hypothetical protein